MRFDLGPIEALESAPLPGGTPLLLAVDSIDEDPAQPRMEFDPGALQELADTIKARGVRQPISVRPHPGQPERWMLNFGSRRLRASKLAGNREIPAFVDLTVDSYDQVIENEQRESLNAMELALFLERQLGSGKTQAEIARALGKSKAYITYLCALIDPPEWLRTLYRTGKCRGIKELYDLRRLWRDHPAEVAQWLAGPRVVSRAGVEALLEQLELSAGDRTQEASTRLPDQEEPGRPSDESINDAEAHAKQKRIGRPTAARPKPSGLLVLAEFDGQTVSVLVDQLPPADDEVFVAGIGGESARPVPIASLGGVHLSRATT